MARLARWSALPLLAAPMAVWALGLGDIELKSALNQPLRADIELVAATPNELDALKVGLANNETFVRYGLDRPAFLSGLQFNVTKDEQGRDVIRVTSHDSITEPFVTMLIEATWARGRLLREYTVLLDPPVMLPEHQAAAARPAETGPSRNGREPTGTIARQVPQPAASSAAPAPRARPAAPTPAAASTAAPGGTYGPVQRGDTLWSIAAGLRPGGATMNQVMLAIYRANPEAFDNNMNVLHRGAVLKIPAAGDLTSLSARSATSEAERQLAAWQDRDAEQARLRLVPASDAAASASPTAANGAASGTAAANGGLQQQVQSLRSQLDESRRLLQIRDDQLRDLQNQLDAANANAGAQAEAPAAATAAATTAGPGVDLESEPLFVDETQQGDANAAGEGAQAPTAQSTTGEAAGAAGASTAAESPAAPPAPATAPAAPTPAPAAATDNSTRVVRTAPTPSLLERVLGWLMSPVLFIALGIAAVLGAAAWYLRRRREDAEDVTGRWEALEAEIDDEPTHTATARLRRNVPEDTGVVVVEQPSQRTSRQSKAAEPEPEPVAIEAPAERSEETLSSQTIIDLDQGDALAEADFHMAYGLYDQAAELIGKALRAEPQRRDLKLKLLEVFFVWGNKEAFLDAARALHAEMGERVDGDWDKVVIMGKQLCPDEPLFAAATASAGAVDVDLEPGESALDFNFESKEESGLDVDLGFGGEEDEDEPELEVARRQATTDEPLEDAFGPLEEDPNLLDVGERTAAGLESVFAEEGQDQSAMTTPDIADSLAATQESPTIETPRAEREDEEAGLDLPTVEALGPNAPTIEAPGPYAPTAEQPQLGTDGTGELPTVEQPKLERSEQTAEIGLDDLGLDVDELADLTGAEEALIDVGAPGSLDQEDGNEDDDLSASRVTRVLEGTDDFENTGTEILSDQEETLLAPGFGEETVSRTAVLDRGVEEDEESDDHSGTERFPAAAEDSGLDLDLEDLSAALDGAETVEQPGGERFTDVFSGDGGTPLDLDVGLELEGADDDPTGTEQYDHLDPQTLTEVGTKLDLARAYIDMGDPEGARSILEEVLDEGDQTQRREAQSLIDVLGA